MPYAPTAMSLNWMWFLFFSFMWLAHHPSRGSVLSGVAWHTQLKQEIPWKTV